MNARVKTKSDFATIVRKNRWNTIFNLIVVGMLSVIFVRDRLIVSLNAEATANNIRNSELLWRTGIVCDVVMHLLDVPIMLIIYALQKRTKNCYPDNSFKKYSDARCNQ
jgi:hypothetical protein